jgi:hypothetical protein
MHKCLKCLLFLVILAALVGLREVVIRQCKEKRYLNLEAVS